MARLGMSERGVLGQVPQRHEGLSAEVGRPVCPLPPLFQRKTGYEPSFREEGALITDRNQHGQDVFPSENVLSDRHEGRSAEVGRPVCPLPSSLSSLLLSSLELSDTKVYET